MKHFAAALLFMIVVGYVAADTDFSCFLEGAPSQCIAAAGTEPDYSVLCTDACRNHFESKKENGECSVDPDIEAAFKSKCPGSSFFLD